MKLDKLTEALRLMQEKYDLDPTDLHVLDEVNARISKRTPVTIMKIVSECRAASPATIHARVKKLCEKDILKKTESDDNMKFKMLTKGPKYDALIAKLGEV